MAESRENHRSDGDASGIYQRAGIGTSVSPRDRPAVVVVDFCCGFTDPKCGLGSSLDREVGACATVLEAARERGHPVVFTTIAFEPDEIENLVWAEKMPALNELVVGTKWVEIDPRLKRRPSEPVVVKQGASGFFGTPLASILIASRADTVILCGATTSGCIRATAVDALQYGWPTLVPRECVGDRAQGPHEANLFDIDSKYGNVVGMEEVLRYLERAKERGQNE